MEGQAHPKSQNALNVLGKIISHRSYLCIFDLTRIALHEKIDRIHDFVEIGGGDQEDILVTLHRLNGNGINRSDLDLRWFSALVDLVLDYHHATLAALAPLEGVVLDRGINVRLQLLRFRHVFLNEFRAVFLFSHLGMERGRGEQQKGRQDKANAPGFADSAHRT
jgi:hypothetical protein